MSEQNEKYGISGPVTLRNSSDESIELSKKLEQYLEKSNFYETEESAQTRERVLGRLDYLLKQFVDELAAPEDKKKTGGKIFTFGSYRLGVHDSGADIDALCVVPRHVQRGDFFTVFYKKLEECEDVDDLSKIEDTYVPLIKMKFLGIPIDLAFARLNIWAVKENLTLLNDGLLKFMDSNCIVSLNGPRVTDAILNLIPCTEVFHSALRAIKFWAKRRYVYGATYGYFNGVAFSISVARICQMYPSYCAYDVVCKFFETYATWKWPNPVMLKEVVNLNYHCKVWDPKVNPSDKYNKMPVITPVYPTMCATSNVTQSTSVLITNEIVRAHEIIKNIKDFIKIFNFTNFFEKYKLYIEICIACSDKNEYLLWNGYVESKVRFLANKLENVENVVGAVPFPKGFTYEEENDAKVNKKTIENKQKTDFANKNNYEDEELQGNKKKIKLNKNENNSEDEELQGNTKEIMFNKNNNNITNLVKEVSERKENTKLNTNKTIDSKETCCKQKQNKLLNITYRTSFFIAVDVLITKATGKKIYVESPISEFLALINSWEKKTPTMCVDVRAKKKKCVLAFVKKHIEIGEDE